MTLLVSGWSGLVIKACGIVFCGTVLVIGTVEVTKGIDRNWGGEENMSYTLSPSEAFYGQLEKGASLVAQMVKNLPAMQATWV